MLYLARKYLIEDLENYTKNFILNNKQTVAGATDVFLYLEMNVKVVYTTSVVCRQDLFNPQAMDDDIRQFAWAQLKSKANIFIRQPRFLEVSFFFSCNSSHKYYSFSRLTLQLWKISFLSLGSIATSGSSLKH